MTGATAVFLKNSCGLWSDVCDVRFNRFTS
jgi:hypothetical protein